MEKVCLGSEVKQLAKSTADGHSITFSSTFTPYTNKNVNMSHCGCRGSYVFSCLFRNLLSHHGHVLTGAALIKRRGLSFAFSKYVHICTNKQKCCSMHARPVGGGVTL